MGLRWECREACIKLSLLTALTHYKYINFPFFPQTACDNFVSNLKSSLSMEKQKNSLLSEELKIKKGTVERLRSELENTKEQLEYLKEEKGNYK